MVLNQEYLRQLFNWVIPEDGEPHFQWAVSPDGVQPVGTVVNTSPMSMGKSVKDRIRVRGKLHSVEDIKNIYGVEE